MLNLKWIRAQPDVAKEGVGRKGFASYIIDDILHVDTERRDLITGLNVMQQELNKISKEIPSSDNKEELKAKAKELSGHIKSVKQRVTDLEKLLDEELLGLPNIPLPDVPKGTGEADNIVISEWGQKPQLDFKPKDHLEIAEHFELLDFERGAKITGSGFPVWRGFGAQLERALIQYMLDVQTGFYYNEDDPHNYNEDYYTEISPPLLVNRDSAQGTGQLPKSEEEMYHANRDDLFLIPTAEVPVTNLHRNEILPIKDLPIKYVAYSPCFRREAGGHGKKTRGFLRVHQFNKVELVQIVEGDLEISSVAHKNILRNATQILEGLGLHYRVIELCDADLSFTAAKCYDIEVWAPGEGRYLEASSCSNFLDFQARRMNLRYRGEDGKVKFCHTLNGSGLATSRVLVALLETYQTAEGHLKVPEVLQHYLKTEMLFRRFKV